MKFRCSKCRNVTAFHLYDYIGTSNNPQKDRILELFGLKGLKETEIIVPCSNQDCKAINTLVVPYYEYQYSI